MDEDQDLTEHADRGAPPPLGKPKAARVFWGRVARVHRDGDPLRYKNKKTGEWEPQYRDADELARMVPQLAGKKVVAPPDKPVHHPQMLTDAKGDPTDVPHRVVGRILQAKLDDSGEYILAEILIDDPDTLQAIDDGVRELSLGYWSRLDKQRYQRKTRIDHLSVVPFARCGQDCELRTDSQDAMEDEDFCSMYEVIALDSDCPCGGARQASPCACNRHAVSMEGTHEVTTMDETQKQLEAAKAEATALKAKLDAAEARATQAEKDRDAARVEAKNAQKDLEGEKARADEAEKAVEDAKVQAQKDAEDQLDARVDSRVDLLTDAQTILGKTLKVKDAEGKDEDRPLSKFKDREIMTAVVKHVDGDDIASDETDDYVRGLYIGALRRAQRATQSRQGVRQAVQANRDAAPKRPTAKQAHADEAEALKRMNQSTANRHRQGR